MKRARVLLADDHRMVAEGLKLVLGDEYDITGIVEDGRALLAAARQLRPDVIVADISMPQLNGINALIQLKKEDPAVKVIFLTMHREAAYAQAAIKAGASGFVLKHAATDELISAIRAVLKGKSYISVDVESAMRQGTTDGGHPSLTPRQREILQLLIEGQSAKEIAQALSISSRTVEFHKYEMMETLGLRNTAELICFGLKDSVLA